MTADAGAYTPVLSALPGPSDGLLAELEGKYKDIHAHPELSMQERRTAGIAAAWLRQQGYEVTEGVGGTGVVGLLRNGDGATVLLRADMDALPIEESTGLPYASQATGTDRFGQATAIAHSCGHDMHVAWLMGATRVLAENRGAWRGTVMAVFQPGEETAQGARAMIADGMVKRFPKPDVTLGQHVMPLSAGQIGWRAGTMLSAGDSWEVTLFGRGAHGSMPQKSIDPVVMAASAVMRLQTVVSREVAMTDSAVVTVGTLRAGMSENVIPDREHANLWGHNHAAAAGAWSSFAGRGRKPGWRRRKACSSVPFNTAVRTSRKGCTVARLQRICCALFMRLATTSLTALSTNAVEIGSPRRLRAA